MSTTSPSVPHQGTQALVLGGGGSTGNAWLIGVLAGLSDVGLDPAEADLTVGTSAGATAVAQISGATPSDLFVALVAASPSPGPVGPTGGGGAARPTTEHLDRMRATIAASEDLADLRRRLGAAALERDAASDGSWQAKWRATVAGRLPYQEWPERAVLITAVDAHTGEPAVFDRESGVDLVDAVAASCSSSFPYRIGGRCYIDGGYRSNADNADLAAGCRRVLVLSPLRGRSFHPPEWGTHLHTQVAELRAGGSRVETVFPDPGSEGLFGANAMNPSLRPAAARAGYDQGRRLADRVADLWR